MEGSMAREERNAGARPDDRGAGALTGDAGIFRNAGAVRRVERLSEGIYSLWAEEADIAAHARAGQFVCLYCKDRSRLLPRPISICERIPESGLLRLVFRIAGAGTEEFSRLREGDSIEMMGPLGNGFSIEGRSALLIGGGIGIPPLLELAKELAKELAGRGFANPARGEEGKAENGPAGKGKVSIALGYRDRDTFLAEAFRAYGDVRVATEDGSAGTRGTALDAVRENGLEADMLYACGPAPMLSAVKALAGERKARAQISMEERMACGIGACLACVCKTGEVDAHSNVRNRRVCKDGPVFYADEIEL